MQSISLSRLNSVLLLVILSVIFLYYGKAFLVPLFFGILLAMLLLPVCNRLEKWGVGRIGSTFIGIFIILLFLAGFVGIIAAQGVSLAEDMPKLQARAQEILESVQQWIQSRYGMGRQEQATYMEKGMDKMSQSGGTFFKTLLSTLGGFLTDFVLVLLYFFFLMWKREKYREFILMLVDRENRGRVGKELDKITHVAGMYLIGRLVSMGFLAIFYMAGFSIVGLPNGLLIALVAVIPTIVPYVGAFIGALFPLAMSFIGGSPDMILPIAGILVVAQVLDNNIIEPLVEGESLDISPIFTIIAIVVGELLWGVAGMILFMPMFAILKIVCDNIPSLNPYSFLLDNEMHESKWMVKIKSWFGK